MSFKQRVKRVLLVGREDRDNIYNIGGDNEGDINEQETKDKN